jgi:hypothetical protein
MSITSQAAVKKWEDSGLFETLDAEAGLTAITDKYKRRTLAMVLENQAREGVGFGSNGNGEFLTEAAPVNNSGITAAGTDPAGLAKYDPILIGMMRRSLPQLMAYDIMGVQAMTGPTGLIFAMKARYGNDRTNAEALYNEANTGFTGTGAHAGSNPATGAYTTGHGMDTVAAEALGTSGGGAWAEMNFSIEKVSVAAKTRALKAEYTQELAQDLKAVHGLDADTELANIVSNEVVFETNRELIRTVYSVAQGGALATTVAGTFDLDVDSNGRWSVEKFKGLAFQIRRDAAVVGQRTRRGIANVMICSSDVASALQMAGVLDYTPALAAQLGINEVDDTGNTFVGTFGKIKVFIDPYSANLSAATQYYVLGYKGSTPYDAGLYYAPYIPLQQVRAIDPNSFQPKMAFKTRFGLVANPFVTAVNGTADGENLTAARNQYYLKTKVVNLF